MLRYRRCTERSVNMWLPQLADDKNVRMQRMKEKPQLRNTSACEQNIVISLQAEELLA